MKAIRRFHPYLYGRSFTIRTDHAALRWLLNFKCPEGQIARWLQELQEYDFVVEHRRGVKHSNADALSRRPCLPAGCKYCDRLEDKEEFRKGGEHIECMNKCFSCQHAGYEVKGSSLSREDLQIAQENDRDIGPVLKWMKDSEIRPTWQTVAPCNEIIKAYWSQWDSLQLDEGMLFRRWETPAGDRIVKQLVLPRSLQLQVLHDLHSTPTAGHLGVAKTLGRIRERFYWMQYSKDVRNYCRKCDLCASRSGPARKIRAPMSQYNVGAPMERLAIDVLGPLPLSDEGNQFILIAADYFSKWVEAYALPNQEATTVAEFLVKEFVARFGVPLMLHSDQGRNFESVVFLEMCALLGITKARTTPLHPQSDGMVERFNRTLEAQLSKFVEDHLPLLLMAYRTAIHESTGCTPASLMLGRDLRLPIDLLYGRPDEEPSWKQGWSECRSLLGVI